MNAAAWLLLVVALVLAAGGIQHARGRHGPGCTCHRCMEGTNAHRGPGMGARLKRDWPIIPVLFLAALPPLFENMWLLIPFGAMLLFLPVWWRLLERKPAPGLRVDGEPLSGPETRRWIGLWKSFEGDDAPEPVYPHRRDRGSQ